MAGPATSAATCRTPRPWPRSARFARGAVGGAVLLVQAAEAIETASGDHGAASAALSRPAAGWCTRSGAARDPVRPRSRRSSPRADRRSVPASRREALSATRTQHRSGSDRASGCPAPQPTVTTVRARHERRHRGRALPAIAHSWRTALLAALRAPGRHRRLRLVRSRHRPRVRSPRPGNRPGGRGSGSASVSGWRSPGPCSTAAPPRKSSQAAVEHRDDWVPG